MEKLLKRIQDIVVIHAAKIAFAVILLFLLGLSFIIYSRSVVPASRNQADLLSNTSATEKVSLDREVREDFELEKGQLEKITIPVYYEEEDNESRVKVVLAEEGKKVQQWQITFGDKEETEKELFLDTPLQIKEGKKYSLIFVNEGEYKEGTGYLGKAKWDIPETSVFVNGEKADYDISLVLSGGTCGYLIPMFWGMFFLLLFSYCFIWYVSVRKKWKAEKMFVVIGAVVGLLYSIVWAPYACPDEYVHIATAYYNVNTLMGTKAVNGEGYTLVRAEDMTVTPSELTTRRYTYHQMLQHWNDTNISNKTTVSMDWQPMKEVPMISYLPQMAAIFLVRLLGWGNVAWLLLGRLFALAVYLAAGYFALKYIPFGKKAIMVLMLGPTAIQEAASFSYDSVLNTCALFFVAYVLYLAYEKKKVSGKDWILLFVSVIIFAPIKIVYLLLSFLVLLIPNRNISRKRGFVYAGKGGLILSSVIVSLFSRINTTSAMTGNTLTVNGQVVEGYSLKMLIMDPLHTAALWMNTLKERSIYYLKQIFGGYESYSKVEISWLIITAFFVLLVLALFVREQEKLIDFKGRLLGIVISTGIFAATILAFNLAKDCTNLTSDCVYGVQGRYFLPFLPLIFISIQNKAIVLKKSIQPFLTIAIFYLQTLAIWGIFETAISR